MPCKYKQYTQQRRKTKLIFPESRLVNMGEFIRQENDTLKPIFCRFCGKEYVIPSHVIRHEKECIKIHVKRNPQEVQLLEDITRIVGAMFKDRTILHCDSCDHESDSALGEKCGWCGGKMVPINNGK